MYTPRQCGVKFDPPALVLYYVENATGKVHRRSMPLRNFSAKTNVDEMVANLKSGKHKRYLENIPSEQIQRLLSKIQEQLPQQKDDAAASSVEVEDLNKLGDTELNKKKAEMDEVFEEHRVRPGDEGFQYDVEVDFENENGKISGWDSDDDYSDPDF